MSGTGGAPSGAEDLPGFQNSGKRQNMLWDGRHILTSTRYNDHAPAKMAVVHEQYHLATDIDGHDEEDDRPTKSRSEAVHENSPLVFEFLKKERRMPSARRLDYMLYGSQLGL